VSQLQLVTQAKPIILTIIFKAKTGMSSRGKRRSVRQTFFSRILQVPTNGPIIQRTRNEQKEVTKRLTTRMTPTGQRKRHQQSPSRRPSVRLTARASAENAVLWQSLYPASLLYSGCLFCIHTIVLPRPYGKGGKDSFEKVLPCAR
jgi:hypothetical protein